MSIFPSNEEIIESLKAENKVLRDKLAYSDRILRACLGTLRKDEELPPWVRWDKVPKSITWVSMNCWGGIESRRRMPLDVYRAAIIYQPHPSLWERSLQRRPSA